MSRFTFILQLYIFLIPSADMTQIGMDLNISVVAPIVLDQLHYNIQHLDSSSQNEPKTSTTPGEFSSSPTTPQTVPKRPNGDTFKTIAALPTVASTASSSAFGFDDCRILKFNPELKDFSLQGFVIKSVEVQRESECKVRCFQENNCLSFNIGLWEENGAYLCELSDSDHATHSGALKPRNGFIYHSTENACAKNPCPLHHSCQNGFTDKGYRCVALANSTPNEPETFTASSEFPSKTPRQANSSTIPSEFSSSPVAPPTISTRPSGNTAKSISALPTVSSTASTSDHE
ncbi:uncharacterized protein LOC111325782 [Stylophora pistillata]|uniref:uncharacterized protein LOC111325782 n=1 Tax=Stylophora pistillata TaxID=50429 RepID=UPI000C03A186|nr:uncharacterized protein LOC111325782 [Stylophora pistillata]